jgi:MraZ protein
MLIGEFRCSADDGGRVPIPAELHPELVEGATVTRGIDRCLVVYPTAKWRTLAEKIEHQLPMTSKLARAFNRLVFSGARACALDQEGQITLPSPLREYADIDDEVVLVGLFSHLEIWSPRRWQEMREESLEDGVALAEELSEFGI